MILNKTHMLTLSLTIKNSINLSAKSLKVNDRTKIIYSKVNPNIVKYLNEYVKSK